jgi:hypothetical protein
MKTVLAWNGGLYHQACMSDAGNETLVDTKVIPAGDLDDEQICDECMGPLVGEEALEDVEPEEEAEA